MPFAHCGHGHRFLHMYQPLCQWKPNLGYSCADFYMDTFNPFYSQSKGILTRTFALLLKPTIKETRKWQAYSFRSLFISDVAM